MSYENDMVTSVQILDETVSHSHTVDTIGKWTHQIILSPAMGN